MNSSRVLFSLVIITFVVSIISILSVSTGKPLVLDEVIRTFVTNIFNESSHPFFKLVTRLGDKIVIGTTAILFILWLWWKKRDYAGMATFSFAVGIGRVFNDLLKTSIARPRPDLEHVVHVNSFSFPSGHAMGSFILYAMIAYLLIRSIKKWERVIWWVASLLIFLIGISRIVLGVHYPTDVIGGFAIGFLWTYLCTSCYELLMSNRVNEPRIQ